MRLFVSGRLGAGKTVLSRKLSEVYGLELFSVVDPIKQEVANALGIKVLELENSKELYRRVFQEWGKVRRVQYGDRYWIGQLVNQLPEDNWVVDSVRAPLEALSLIEAGAFHLHLDVSPDRQLQYLTEMKGLPVQQAMIALEDSSEHWLDKWVENYESRGAEWPGDERPERPDLVVKVESDSQVWEQVRSWIVSPRERKPKT